MNSLVKLTFTVWKEGIHYVAQCLNVEVSSFGDTYEEALTNVREALQLYLEGNTEQDIVAVEMPAITVSEVTSE